MGDIIKINKLYNCNGGGTKPTPKPTPTGTCVDDNTSCAGWAQIGECQKNPDYMLKSCRKSCNQCSTTSSKCVDKNTSCPQWASGGHCAKVESIWFPTVPSRVTSAEQQPPATAGTSIISAVPMPAQATAQAPP